MAVAGAVVLVAALAGFAHAEAVVVQNADFSSPSTGPGGWNSFGATGWSGTQLGYAAYGNYNHTGDPGYPGVGGYVGYVNNGEMYQDVGALLANTIYTLTVDVGSRVDAPGSGKIELYNGTAPVVTGLLATSGTVSPAAGTFTPATIQFTTGATVSGDLTVALGIAGGVQANFANVRLDALTQQVTPPVTPEAAAVPLPASAPAGLALLGGMGLVHLRRRRALLA